MYVPLSSLLLSSEMTACEKTVRVLINIMKGVGVLGLLYFFIISIDLLGSAFQLIAGQCDVMAAQVSDVIQVSVTSWQVSDVVTGQ